MRILSLTQTMRRPPAIPPARGRGLAALSLILLGGIAACGSDGGTGPGADIAGTYALRQINNAALPMSETYSWGIDSFDGGSLRLEADGTWSLEIHGGSSFGFDGGFPVPWTVTDFGEFEHDGVNLGFSSASADVQFSGSWNGETVTIHYNWDPLLDPDPETEFVFER